MNLIERLEKLAKELHRQADQSKFKRTKNVYDFRYEYKFNPRAYDFGARDAADLIDDAVRALRHAEMMMKEALAAAR